MKDFLSSLERHFDAKAWDRLAFAAALILTVLLAHGLASLTWSLLPRAEQPPPPTAPLSEAPAVARADFSRLSNLHLFGRAQSQQRTAAPIDAPETSLNLTLRGILYNPDPKQARAIISAPNKEDEMYRVGDQVPGGATIDQIYADRVMLLRNGQYETLRLPEDRLNLPGGAAAAADSGGSPSLPSAGQEVLAEYRRQLIETPENASQYIQAEPVNQGGSGIAGFRVNPGADPAMFNLAGLQPGDIVTAVNELQLDTVDKGFEAIEELAASEEITLKVLRNGQEQTIQLQLKQ